MEADVVETPLALHNVQLVSAAAARPGKAGSAPADDRVLARLDLSRNQPVGSGLPHFRLDPPGERLDSRLPSARTQQGHAAQGPAEGQEGQAPPALGDADGKGNELFFAEPVDAEETLPLGRAGPDSGAFAEALDDDGRPAALPLVYAQLVVAGVKEGREVPRGGSRILGEERRTEHAVHAVNHVDRGPAVSLQPDGVASALAHGEYPFGLGFLRADAELRDGPGCGGPGCGGPDCGGPDCGGPDCDGFG